MNELMRRRRALMATQAQEENMLSVSSLNINGELRIKEVTVGTNSVTNASQILPYFNGFLDNGERLIMFSAINFTNTNNGIKYGFKIGAECLYTDSPHTTVAFGRYKNGSVTDIYNIGTSYDAKLTEGNTYIVLYTKDFAKT